MQNCLQRHKMNRLMSWRQFQAILFWAFSTNPIERILFTSTWGYISYIPSKHILDALSKLGLTCSYNDVRQIATSLAKQEIDDNEELYVPKCLEQVTAEKQNFIRANIDNFDMNEETLDGKN
ncbi:unnamed protein product, partial [Callosobruchus maculatus]